MSDCCEDNKDTKKTAKQSKVFNEKPKSIIGKYLYNMGKKDLEKEKQGGKQKGCC